MEILFILIPLSIFLVAIAIFIFNWAVKSGQFDDMEGPAHSILFDDDDDMIPTKQTIESTKKTVAPETKK